MDASPYVGILGAIVMWFGLIICLCLIKGFIVQGTAMALAEFLLKLPDNSGQERICRWLGDSGRIMDYLKEIEPKQK
jgi:hypothetical protein